MNVCWCNKIRFLLTMFVYASSHLNSRSTIMFVPVGDNEIFNAPWIVLFHLTSANTEESMRIERAHLKKTKFNFDCNCELRWFVQNFISWKLSIDPSMIVQRKFLHVFKRTSELCFKGSKEKIIFFTILTFSCKSFFRISLYFFSAP